MESAWTSISNQISNLVPQTAAEVEEEKDINTDGTKKDRYKCLMSVIKDHGYPCEKHFITTEDNYINCAYRISGPRGTNAEQNATERSSSDARPKPVVLYQHGLFDSAAGICMDGKSSIAFYFADHGFDVWMGNQRGNRNSKNHKYKECSEDDFWNFSFYELGKYDQPALISYILRETEVPNLSYIGHSQGTTQIFSALAEDADFFRERVNLFLMLAPVARVDRCMATSIRTAATNTAAQKIMKKMGPELLPAPQVGSKFMSGLLQLTGIAKSVVGLASDDDPTKMSEEGFKNYLGHFPAGTSHNCVEHYRQLFLARRFQKFDFGIEENLKKYGSEQPPEISLRSFSDMPIAMFCGATDKLASPHDYMWLREELVSNNNCVFYKEYDFGHLAFLVPSDKTIIHDMFALAKRYNPLYSARDEQNLTAEQKSSADEVALNVANMTLTRDAFSGVQEMLNVQDGYLDRL